LPVAAWCDGSKSRKGTIVAKYLLAYVGGGEMPSTPEAQYASVEAWGAWFGSIGAGVADPGNPFGPSTTVASSGSVTDGAASGLTGYTLLTADSLAAAVEHAKGCPLLSNGGSIQVFETFNMM